MARLVGVDIPKNKSIYIGLTYIYGVGNKVSKEILKKLNIELSVKTKDLSENNVVDLRNELMNRVLEGDLKRKVAQNIRRLKEIGSRKGFRHSRSLPVRGQRTSTNARTKRGKKIAIAGKKKATR